MPLDRKMANSDLITRNHRARLLSYIKSGLIRILHQYFTHSLYVYIRGGDYNASSGIGLWAKTLRGQ